MNIFTSRWALISAQEWLEATCERTGWKHEHSPLVWRELVEQGGKGMLLGGLSDFLEHCQVRIEF